MKKLFLLLPLFSILLYLMLGSNASGPGSSGSSDLTGARGSSSGCSCHVSSATTSLRVSIALDSAGFAVTHYIAGNTYNIILTGSNSTGSTLPTFGFQVACVTSSSAGSSSAQDAGTLSAPSSSEHVYTVSSTFHIVEHGNRHAPSSGTGASGSTTYSISIPWTAPATSGSGSVVLYGILNAVNGTTSSSGGSGGDKWNFASAVTITELVPAAVVGAITGPSDVCIGNTITLSDTSAGGTWTSSDTTIARINSTGVVTGVGVGVAYITYTTSAGAAYDTITVSLASAGVITGPRPRRVCVGSNITLTNTPGGGTWVTGSPTIASINPGTGQVTGLSAGTAYISYQVVASCGTVYALDTVRVIALPTVSAITGAPSVCTGDTTRMTDTTGGGTWSLSSTSLATITSTGLVTGLSAGTDTVFYSVTGSCGTTRVFALLNILAGPNPGTISGSSPICVGTPVAFTSSGTSGGSWSTSSGIASVSTTGTVYGSSSGTVTVSYTVFATGCGSRSATYPTTVLVSVSAGAILASRSTICAHSLDTITTTTTGGTWTSTPASVASINPSTGLLYGLSAGTANITYIVTSSCGNDTGYTSVTINALPDSGTITGTTSICRGDSTVLSNATAVGVGVWSTSFGAIASVNSTTGRVYGINPGTASIIYTANTATCGSASTSVTFTVNGAPVLAAISGPAFICVGSTGSFSDSVTGGRWSSSLPAVATVDSVSGVVTGLSAGSTTLTYRVTTACGSSAVTRTVNVSSPAAAGTIGGRTPFCVGGLDTFTVSGATPGGTWSTGTPSVASVLDATNGYFIGTGTGMATISYSIASAGCAASVSTYSPTVVTTPSAGVISGPSTICRGTTTTYTETVTGGAWSTSASSVASVSTTGDVTGVASGSANITYTVSNSCGSNTAVYPITVNVPPTVTPLGGPDSVCEGGSFIGLTVSPTGGSWATDASTIASVDGIGVVTGVSAGGANISYTASNTCGSTTVGKHITVKPLPNAGSISGTSVICASSSVTLTPTIPGGAWNSSATGTATVSNTGVVTGVATGAVNISYTITNSCGSAVTTYPISIIATPVAGTISGSSSSCTGAPLSYSYSGTSGGVWSSSNTTVATVDGSGNITSLTAGTTTISYILTTTCRNDTATQTLTVSATPSAGVISGTSGICVGATTTLSTTGTGGTWTSATGAVASIDASGVVNGIATGAEIISYTATSASCGTSIASYTVNVATAPSAGTVTGTSSFCEGTTVTLATTGTGGAWSSTAPGIASVDATGVVRGNAGGTANISYTVSNACGADSAGLAVTVNPLPVAGGISGPSSLCPGATVNLTHTGSVGSWSSGSPTIASVNATGVVNGIVSGSATISYTVTNGCGSAYATYVVVVNPLPSAGVISGPSTLCTGTSGTLSSTVTGGAWSTSNASVASISAGTLYAVANGTATITYIVNNSCGADTAYYPVTINTSASVGAISGPTTVCEAASIILTNSTSGGSWSSASPLIATVNSTGTVLGLSAGSAVISYTLTTTCGTAIASYTVTVNPLPVPGTITGTDSVCAGSSVTLADAAGSGTWSTSAAGIASVDAFGVVNGVTAGSATISYTVSNSCGTQYAVRAFRVLPLPSAGTISGATAVCTGATIALTSTVSGGAWSSSTPTTASISAGGVVNGVATGSTTIVYSFTNSCGTSTTTHVVTVNTTPVVSAITGLTSVCTGSTISLSSTTTGGTWSSSAPAIASVNTTGVVAGVSAGSAIITYAVSNTCGTTIQTHSVTVNAIPTVAAITGASSVCPGASVTLSSSTTGGAWSTSAATTASVNPATGVVTGVAAGTATISYSVTGICGTGSTTATITVNPSPYSGSISGSSSVCVGDTTSLRASVTGGSWSSSATGVASVNTSGLVTGFTSGTANIIYSVSNVCGTASSAHTVVVNNVADPGTISGPFVVCRGGTISLSSPVSGGTWRSAASAIAVVSPTGTVSGVSQGIVSISYTVTNGCGSNSATYDIQVDAPVANGDINGSDTLCIGDTVVYTIGVSRGVWRSSTGNISINSGGTATAVGSGTDTLVYTVNNACGISSARLVVRILSAGECGTAIHNVGVALENISIVPNPSNGMLTVQVPVTDRNYQVTVMDMTGKVIYTQVSDGGINSIALNLSELAAGNYIVKITSEGSIFREKITIAK